MSGFTADALRSGNVLTQAEWSSLRERMEFHAWVDDATRVGGNDRAHCDGPRDHARHREARRCGEACRSHSWNCDRDDGCSSDHCDRLVGHTMVATIRPFRDWDMHLAMAATARATSKH